MRPIPKKNREIMEADPWYHRCCLCGKTDNETKIDWHHSWQYSGKQIVDIWATAPLCGPVGRPHSCHAMVHGIRQYRRMVEKITLERATAKDLAKYPKKNWKIACTILGISK